MADLGVADGVPSRRSLKALKKANSLPVYHQLSSILRQWIKDGVFVPDSPMPTEMQLANEFEVSRVTVRRALEALEAEGRIVRKHGVGTFVKASAGDAAAPMPRVVGPLEVLIPLGVATEVELLGYEPEKVPSRAVKRALALPEGEAVLKLVRLRSHVGRRLAVSRIYVRKPYDAMLPRHIIDCRTVERILEDGGQFPVRAEQTLTAVPADAEVARGLGIEVSMPVICVRRTAFDAEGNPMFHHIGFLNPDTYEYQQSLVRATGTERPYWRLIG